MKKYFLIVISALLFLFTIQGSIAAALGDNLIMCYSADEAVANQNTVVGNFDFTSAGSPGVRAGKVGANAYDAPNDDNTNFRYVANQSQIPIGDTDFTIVTWHLLDSVDAGANQFYSSLGSVQADSAAMLYVGVSGLNNPITFADGGGSDTIIGVNTTTAVWYHSAVTYNHSNRNITTYFNGTQRFSRIQTLPLNRSSNTYWIGQYINNASFGEFDGAIDEVMIFNAALTPADISFLYNSTTGVSCNYVYDTRLPSNNFTLINNITNATIGTLSFWNIYGNLTFTYFNITDTGFCVAYTGNGTGSNCTGGSGTSTFFNTSVTQIITTPVSISQSAHQAVINLQALRLFLNTTISSFNASNNGTTNTTSTGQLIIKALTGSNTITIQVAGNYSVNITCTVPGPLQTVNCNATGIYDTRLTVGANDGITSLNDFTVQVFNSTLGGTLYTTGSGSNNSVVLPLLRGYNYSINITKSSYRSNATNRLILGANDSYNGTLQALTVGLLFLDEQNRTIITGTNIQFTIVDANNTETNYNTTNGQSNIVGTLPAGDYTIRYSASGYSSREYYFTLGFATQNLSLYMIPSTLYTPGIVEIRNFDTSLVIGAIIKLKRSYGNSSIPNVVEMATTGTDGSATMTAEAVTGFYTWEVVVNDITRFNTTTPELLLIQADGLWYRTFGLFANNTDAVTQQTGVLYYFTPQSAVTNGTIVTFGFNITSSYWNITSCSLVLTNLTNGVILGSNSTFCTTSTGPTITINLPQNGTIIASGTITTDTFINTYNWSYPISNAYDSDYSLYNWVQDVRSFNSSGFNDFSRLFLAFIFIAVITLGATSKFDALSSPENALILVLGLTLIVSYLGFLRITTMTGAPEVIQMYIVSLLVGTITIITVYRRWNVT